MPLLVEPVLSLRPFRSDGTGLKLNKRYMYSEDLDLEIVFLGFLVVPFFRFLLLFNALLCTTGVVTTSFQVGWHWFRNTIPLPRICFNAFQVVSISFFFLGNALACRADVVTTPF